MITDKPTSQQQQQQKIKNHIEIANELDLVDFERAGKIAGARFYFLKNDLVRLGLALTNFAIDYLIEKELYSSSTSIHDKKRSNGRSSNFK